MADKRFVSEDYLTRRQSAADNRLEFYLGKPFTGIGDVS